MTRTPDGRTKEKLLQDNVSLLARLAEAEASVRAAGEADQALIRQLREEMGARSNVEEAAKAERQRLFDVLEALPVYVALLDKDYRVPFANRFFRERFGESHGRCCFDYLFNRTTPCDICETYKVVRTGGPHHWEWTGPDGRNYDIYDYPFTDTDGSMLILETGIDITERKKAEAELSRHQEHLEQMILDRTAALAASEKRYRVLFETMSEGFAAHEIITDEQGRPCDYRFLEANPAFERLTGLAAADLIGKRVLEVLPGTEPYWIETYGRVAHTGHPVHFERFFPPLNRWYGVFAYRTRPGQFAVVFSDITARKQAEEEVGRQREWLRVTLTSIGDAVIAGDTDGRITFLNPVAADLTGWSEQEALGQPIQAVFVIINEQTRQPAEDLVRRVLTEGRRIALANDTALVTRAGRVVPIEDSAAPILDAAGHVSGFVLVFHDVTEKRRAQQALNDLTEALERRVSERTAEVQEQAVRLRALAADLGQTEQRERKRLARILHDHVQQLLAAARIELEVLKRAPAADQTTDNAERADSILSEAMQALRSLAVELSPPILYETGLVAGLRWLGARMGDQHQFHVNVHADSRAEPASEDLRVLLFECVRELLLNALKHSGVREAGVSVTRTPEHGIRIVVEDAGRGFDPRGIWTGTDGRGTFGLFSVQERLAHLCGSMQIESAPGQGTRVVLIAPLVEEPAAPGDRPTRSAGGATTAGRAVGDTARTIRILVVDDHPIVREGLVKSLQFEPDLEVVGEAADAPQAVALAGTLEPDVVIMDVNLGTTSGIDATRHIRRVHPQINVLGLSIHEDEHVAAAMRRAGAVAYLSKAGRVEDLIAAIRACKTRGTQPGPGRPEA